MISVAEIKGSLSIERWSAERDLWGVRYVIRPSAAYLAWLFIWAKVSCKRTVLLGLVLGLTGCLFVAFGIHSTVIVGCVLLILGSWLDYVDGTIARATDTTDKAGAYLDLTCDNLMAASVPIAVGIGASMPVWGVVLALLYTYSTLSIMDGRQTFGIEDDIYRDGESRWSLWRLAFVAGTNIQSLHLLLLLAAAITSCLHIYLYTFTFLAGCEVIAIIAKRAQNIKGHG